MKKYDKPKAVLNPKTKLYYTAAYQRLYSFFAIMHFVSLFSPDDLASKSVILSNPFNRPSSSWDVAVRGLRQTI